MADNTKHPLSDAQKRKSVEDMLDDPKEADRILGYVIGDKAVKHFSITDFGSFKEAFRDAFQRGAPANRVRLWDVLGSQDDLLLQLYGQTSIQDKVTRDGKEIRVLELMGKHHIQRHQANELYQKEREHEIQIVKEGRIPPVEGRVQGILESISPTTAPRRAQISQAVRAGGNTYSRTKPTKFTIPQERFLRNNPHVPTPKLAIQFNLLFRENRTTNSVYNKRYRLLRIPSP
jgi:hypothetical protein